MPLKALQKLQDNYKEKNNYKTMLDSKRKCNINEWNLVKMGENWKKIKLNLQQNFLIGEVNKENKNNINRQKLQKDARNCKKR